MQTRKSDMDNASTQHQWLAMTVTTHQTICDPQRDGYTIVLQSDPKQDIPRAAGSGITPGEDDAFMTDDQTVESPASTNTHSVAQQSMDLSPQRNADTHHASPGKAPGVRRFLCAEYINSSSSRH